MKLATNQQPRSSNIEARVVVDVLDENFETVCQSLACEIADLIHLNNFGCEVSQAKITGISRDSFKPEFDPFVCWSVEWSHQFHIGDSVWDNDGIQSHTIYISEEVKFG